MIQRIGVVTFDFIPEKGVTKIYEDGWVYDDGELRCRGTFKSILSNIATLGLERGAEEPNAVSVFVNGRVHTVGAFYLSDVALKSLIDATEWGLLAPYHTKESEYPYLNLIVLDNFHHIYERKSNRKVKT